MIYCLQTEVMPLKRKYWCFSESTWREVIHILVSFREALCIFLLSFRNRCSSIYFHAAFRILVLSWPFAEKNKLRFSFVSRKIFHFSKFSLHANRFFFREGIMTRRTIRFAPSLIFTTQKTNTSRSESRLKVKSENRKPNGSSFSEAMPSCRRHSIKTKASCNRLATRRAQEGVCHEYLSMK